VVDVQSVDGALELSEVAVGRPDLIQGLEFRILGFWFPRLQSVGRTQSSVKGLGSKVGEMWNLKT
jgi:hypothetical protein